MVKRIKWYRPTDKKAIKAAEYLSYKEKLSWEARQNYKGDPLTGPIHLNLTFHIPMPESWSAAKKKRMDGQLHTSKPDRDNLEKGVCDALNKIVWKDDGQVCMGSTIKRYSSRPRIEIEVNEIAAEIA